MGGHLPLSGFICPFLLSQSADESGPWQAGVNLVLGGRVLRDEVVYPYPADQPHKMTFASPVAILGEGSETPEGALVNYQRALVEHDGDLMPFREDVVEALKCYHLYLQDRRTQVGDGYKPWKPHNAEIDEPYKKFLEQRGYRYFGHLRSTHVDHMADPSLLTRTPWRTQ